MVTQSVMNEIRREDERMRRWGYWLAEHLPQVSVGTGLTKHERPPLPQEVSSDFPRVRRALEAYWQDQWPTDPDGERYLLRTAIAWATNQTGPNVQAPQDILWYAKEILHHAQFLSPGVDRHVQGHAEHVMAEAVESAYKIGVLFREATWKFDHEPATLNGYQYGQNRLKGSVAGGDATKRAAEKRRQILSNLALKSVYSWAGLSENQQISYLMKLAQAHDKTADPMLFHRKGALLAKPWFVNFLSELRASGAIQEALQRP